MSEYQQAFVCIKVRFMLQKKGIKCPNILMDGQITTLEDNLKVEIL